MYIYNVSILRVKTSDITMFAKLRVTTIGFIRLDLVQLHIENFYSNLWRILKFLQNRTEVSETLHENIITEYIGPCGRGWTWWVWLE